jgi:hypothetical protein
VSNDLTKRILELETQINRLAIERQNFFNIEAQLKNDILEKEDLLQEKEEAVKMMKAQLIILLEEIDILKRNNKMLTANSTLIPSNVIKKIRGGNHNEKVSSTYLNTDFNDSSILTGNEVMTSRGGQKGRPGQVSIGKNSSSLANSFAQSKLGMTADNFLSMNQSLYQDAKKEIEAAGRTKDRFELSMLSSRSKGPDPSIEQSMEEFKKRHMAKGKPTGPKEEGGLPLRKSSTLVDSMKGVMSNLNQEG